MILGLCESCHRCPASRVEASKGRAPFAVCAGCTAPPVLAGVA